MSENYLLSTEVSRTSATQSIIFQYRHTFFHTHVYFNVLLQINKIPTLVTLLEAFRLILTECPQVQRDRKVTQTITDPCSTCQEINHNEVIKQKATLS